VGVAAFAWVRFARWGHRRRVRALSENERAALAAWFTPDLLDAVRVVEVAAVRLPLAGVVRRVTGGRLALDGPAGIALGPEVVIARPRCASRWLGVLFHELVHVAQYRALGERRFLSRHLRSWWAGGRSYLDVGAEVQAYAMQERFERGEVFGVEDEIAALP
jgi:hypothetical protein